MPVIIRHPRPDESLTPLWPSLEKYQWNLDHVWVAEHEGAIVAGAIIWDSGHDIVQATNLTVLEHAQQKGVAVALLEGIRQHLAELGRKVIVSSSTDVRMAYWAQKRGAVVGPAAHLIWWEIA